MVGIFSAKDIELLKEKNISPETVEKQLAYFTSGFPYLNITNNATTEKGILIVDDTKKKEFIEIWKTYAKSSEHNIIKFVPASGAASRMFKNLFDFLDAISDLPETDFLKTFFINLNRFPFYHLLNSVCLKKFDLNIDSLIEANRYKDIVKALLFDDDMSYGNLPKGLIPFHTYNAEMRTPVEEQIEEGVLYALSGNNSLNIHFTVSPEHLELFQKLIEKVKKQSTIKLKVSFSIQKPSTDTIAVDAENKPLRDTDGLLLFRPGGHGALIENLNDLQADIAFIKNIDNVVPDHLKENEATYKQLLAGYLVKTQSRIFEYLELIDSGDYDREKLLEVLYFTQQELNIKNPEIKLLEDAELVLYLKNKLNRPIRVCGMVQNIGEPGGGPFFAANKDGTVSLQILENSQIDMNDPEKKELFQQSAYFNPVDLVCGLKNYKGNCFDLKDFVDYNTGFISKKSKNGKELKALELPGLWNGAMSNWNTIFIEVPLSTFNPVKAVNDLLRKEHQNE